MNFLLSNPNECHFMVDIETLATTYCAAITEIGAVVLYETDKNIYVAFHRDCFDAGGVIDGNTMAWREDNKLPWKLSDECPTLAEVLVEFSNYILTVANGREPIIWCKGTDFDTIILTNAYQRNNLKVPWKYNAVRDVRTLLSIFPQFKIPKEEMKHNGLADAAMQAEQLRKIANHMEFMASYS